MTVDSAIQLLRTASLPRLRERLSDHYSNDQIFFEKLCTLLVSAQPVECKHRWETIGPEDAPVQRCLNCGKTLLVPKS